MRAPARYRARAADWGAVPLDELTAVYHRPSGLTHLLAAPAYAVLEALGAAQTADLDALLAQLQARFDVADAEPAALAARLDELIAAGLVERL